MRMSIKEWRDWQDATVNGTKLSIHTKAGIVEGRVNSVFYVAENQYNDHNPIETASHRATANIFFRWSDLYGYWNHTKPEEATGENFWAVFFHEPTQSIVVIDFSMDSIS